MPFQKGEPRKPGAGRKPGSKNKKTLLKVTDFLLNNNINPTEEIVKLIPSLLPEDQLRAWIHLTAYSQSKPKEFEDDSDDFDDEIDQLKDVSNEALILMFNQEKQKK